MIKKDYLRTIYRLDKNDYSKILIEIGKLNIGINYGDLFEIIGTEVNIPNKIINSVLQPRDNNVCILFSQYKGSKFKELLIKNKIDFESEEQFLDGLPFRIYLKGKLFKEGDENILK
jgi:hypothetical protein